MYKQMSHHAAGPTLSLILALAILVILLGDPSSAKSTSQIESSQLESIAQVDQVIAQADDPEVEDSDSDGVPDSIECPVGPPFDAATCPDTDGDEVADYLDIDDDGDGIETRYERRDIDGDGQPDNIDSDFFCQVDTGECPAHPDYLDSDDDGDGLPTAQEQSDPNRDGNPDDAQNSDDDELPDYLDSDDDNDTRPTNQENAPDQDSDGDELPDYLDADDDNDGLLTLHEGPGGCQLDFCNVPHNYDGDEWLDYLDTDDDNDGIPTAEEQADPNQDGDPRDAVDSDEDDQPDYLDDGDDNTNQDDEDSDGVDNRQECESGPPFDSGHCPDSDFDDLPDFADDDDDNDGILSRNEGSAAPIPTDADGDTLPDYLEPNNLDTDGDGIPNPEDPDDDGDDVPTAQECPNQRCLDNDRDRIPAHLDPDDVTISFSGGDSDGDGIGDTDECPGGYPCRDSDGDGQPDYMTSSTNGFTFELRIEDAEADTSDVAVRTAPQIMLRFEYEVENTGNTELIWRKLEENGDNLEETCELPRIIPVNGSATCLIQRSALASPEGTEHRASARVVSSVAAADTGAVFMDTQENSAWYRTALDVSTIGDYVWEDLDQDGIQDADEPGLPGVQVELYDLVGQVVAQTVTDNNGFYRFTGVEAGGYRVGFVLPDETALVFTRKDQTGDTNDSDANPSSGRSDPVLIEKGTVDETIDAGITGLLSSKPSTLGDSVWEDLNGNGLQDTGEPALAGATVQLLNRNGIVIQTTLSDSSGRYFFTPLIADQYQIRFIRPNGYQFTIANQDELDEDDSDAQDFPNEDEGDTEIIDLGVSVIDTRWDVGFYRPIQLGNFVWEDQNGDGLQDEDEPGVADVEIELYRAGQDETPIDTTISDADGQYSFDDQAPGTYYVRVLPPTTHTITDRDQGADDLDSDVNPITGISGQATLPSGGKNETLDIGLVRQSTIGDLVWQDLNDNGLQDSGEPGVANVKVELRNSDGVVIGTATTDADGSYGFTAVPGSYTVAFTAPSGFQFVSQDSGSDDAADSDADPATGVVEDVLLASGMDESTIDAGLTRTEELINIQVIVNGIDLATEGDPQILLGEPVEVVYIVGNMGTTPLRDVVVTDEGGAPIDGLTCSDTTILADGTITCEFLTEAEEGLELANLNVTATLEDGSVTTTTQEEPIQVDVIESGVDLSIAVMDNEDPFNAGNILQYTIVYTNNSPVDATNVTLIDTLPLGVLFNGFERVEPELVLPIPTISPEGQMILTWQIPTLAAGTSGEIVFFADTDPNLGGETIDNVVSISSETPEDTPEDNSATEMTTFRLFGMGLIQPTALDLLDFSASPAHDGILVRWVTAAEIDTSGFSLYRASNGKWEDAAKVTDELIQAAGNVGGEYTFRDFSATPNVHYTYWLVETENDGAENRYGPVDSHRLHVATIEHLIYLPLVTK